VTDGPAVGVSRAVGWQRAHGRGIRSWPSYSPSLPSLSSWTRRRRSHRVGVCGRVRRVRMAAQDPPARPSCRASAESDLEVRETAFGALLQLAKRHCSRRPTIRCGSSQQAGDADSELFRGTTWGAAEEEAASFMRGARLERFPIRPAGLLSADLRVDSAPRCRLLGFWQRQAASGGGSVSLSVSGAQDQTCSPFPSALCLAEGELIWSCKSPRRSVGFGCEVGGTRGKCRQP